ncbi:beta-lactamase family protein [Orientia chuto str. Dubai]|uniref:Beta-lactamase family protein n=1 Tax=Orientia chuto str. Dubai TaxID=1359168 RepID=A0A0F3MSI9_9RICK|nr:serine hydrolase domain-containing protein [Candidatus Orientia mediorientalis]KJV57549.1 beta-lactamase family protein [Orientia chuto str. Dubai]
MNINASYYIATNKIIAQGAVGYLDCSTRHYKIKHDTLMPIASITKSMTAAAIMILYEQEKLKLNDCITKHIPENYWPDNKPPTWANTVSIHQLLSHTSGIIDPQGINNSDISKKLFTPEMSDMEIKQTVLKTIVNQQLQSAGKYHYSNLGYFILGLIIENTSKQDLKDFFSEKFFKPLQMNNTYLLTFQEGFRIQALGSKKIPDTCIIQYNKNQQDVSLVKVHGRVLATFSAGGVISNVQDLHKWNLALHNMRVVSNDSYKKMTTSHVIVDDPEENNKLFVKSHYGYGLKIGLLANGNKIYGHSGNYCARSELWYMPSKSVSIAILSNIFIPQPLVNNPVAVRFNVQSLLKYIVNRL